MESLQNRKAIYIETANKRAELNAQIERLKQVSEQACKVYNDLEELRGEIEDEDLIEIVIEAVNMADELQGYLYNELNMED